MEEFGKAGVYDWLIEYEDLDAYLQKYLTEAHGASSGGAHLTSLPVCVVGCGTSTLSERMAASTWWSPGRTVLSADYDAGVIAHMAKRTAGNASLQWATVDFSRDLDQPHAEVAEGMVPGECATALVAGGFSGVVDKGTLDAMLCEGLGGNNDDDDDDDDFMVDGGGDGSSSSGTSASASAALLVNAARLLAPGSGKMVLVSLHPPQLVAKLLAVEALGFDATSLSVHVLPHSATAPSAAAAATSVELVEAIGSFVGSAEGRATSAAGSGDNYYDRLPNALATGEHTLAVITRSAVPWEELINNAAAHSTTSAFSHSAFPSPPPATATAMNRPPTMQLRVAVEAVHQVVLDTWFREQQPLLTPERQAALEAAWAAAVAGVGAFGNAHRALPLPPPVDSCQELAATATSATMTTTTQQLEARLGLRAAYEAMFLAEERAEYEFDDFLEDFQSGKSAEETSGDSTTLSLADAIEFLRANQ